MSPSQRARDLLIYLMIVIVLILIVYVVAQIFYSGQQSQGYPSAYNTPLEVR